MARLKYEFLEHTSEMKFKAYGKTLGEAFENAALALSSFIAKDNKIKLKKKKTLCLHGEDKESLLYDFIEEIVTLLDAENFIVAKAKVKLQGKTLNAIFHGDNSKSYKGLDHIKSPTYSEMQIKKIRSRWEIQAVVDV